MLDTAPQVSYCETCCEIFGVGVHAPMMTCGSSTLQTALEGNLEDSEGV
jgi:hypothetical protein